MTKLTPGQFEHVGREIEDMLSDERVVTHVNEGWRVMRMFAGSQFNYALGDFPPMLQKRFRELGTERKNSYEDLLGNFHIILKAYAEKVFDITSFGSFSFEGKEYELIKIATKPPASSFAERLPICLVAGVHGDEVDGVWAALHFARDFSRIPELVSTYALTIYPCINPVGYERMTRENGKGKDLNREFGRASDEIEVQIMERELGGQEFTGFISGHSDFESFGLYAYATGPVISERLAKPALFQASGIIPINLDAVIDGYPAQYGIINQRFPGSLGPLTKGKTEPFEITIETPNLFSLRKRVEAQAIAFETILQEYRAVAAEGMYL